MPPPPPKKTPAETSVREVLLSMNPKVQGQPPRPRQKAKPNLTAGPLANFDHGTIPDIAQAIKAVVSRDGDGVLAFAPALGTIGAPGKYTVQVSVGEGTDHTAAGPVPLAFEILKADAALVVGALADFDYGTVPDIAQAIKDLVKHEGDGVPAFEPALDTLALPKQYTVQVSVGEGTNHKAAGPAALVFEVRRLEPKLTLPVVADHTWDEAEDRLKNKFFQNLFAPLVATFTREAGYGELKFTPKLADLKYIESDYAIKVSLAQGRLYKKSEVEVVKFKIFMNAMGLSSAFEKWWAKAIKRQQDKLGGKAKVKVLFCGDPSKGVPAPMNYAGEKEFFKALDAASAGLPSKREIWAELGYTSMNNASAWVLEKKGQTTQGKKMHLTVSFDNIEAPDSNIWGQADQAIFDALFRPAAVTIPMRLHMSLEDFPTQGRNLHVFLGNGGYVNGNGDARAASDADGQVGEMIAELQRFESAMVSRIGTMKTKKGFGT